MSTSVSPWMVVNARVRDAAVMLRAAAAAEDAEAASSRAAADLAALRGRLVAHQASVGRCRCTLSK